jgi:hypothetical protein
VSAPDWTKSREAKRRKRVSDAFDAVFHTPQGELVLAMLADQFFAHRTTYSPDERTHCLNEGQRMAWLWVEGMLRLKRIDLERLAQVAEGYRTE